MPVLGDACFSSNTTTPMALLLLERRLSSSLNIIYMEGSLALAEVRTRECQIYHVDMGMALDVSACGSRACQKVAYSEPREFVSAVGLCVLFYIT
eukprot:scaffold3807_cov39-Prasinocladus_malaysianus.AAC.1